MLISPKGRQVILTPTKTGTKSLEAALKAHGWTVSMPRHTRQVPITELNLSTVPHLHVVIRNPYDRLRSMYTFGLHTKHSTLLRWAFYKGSNDNPSFQAFLLNWAAARVSGRNLDWTTTYSEYLKAAAQQGVPGVPVRIHKIEHGTAPILKAFKLPEEDRHVNKSHDRVTVRADALWTPYNVNMVKEHLKDDLELGNYAIPTTA